MINYFMIFDMKDNFDYLRWKMAYDICWCTTNNVSTELVSAWHNCQLHLQKRMFEWRMFRWVFRAHPFKFKLGDEDLSNRSQKKKKEYIFILVNNDYFYFYPKVTFFQCFYCVIDCDFTVFNTNDGRAWPLKFNVQ